MLWHFFLNYSHQNIYNHLQHLYTLCMISLWSLVLEVGDMSLMNALWHSFLLSDLTHIPAWTTVYVMISSQGRLIHITFINNSLGNTRFSGTGLKNWSGIEMDPHARSEWCLLCHWLALDDGFWRTKNTSLSAGGLIETKVAIWGMGFHFLHHVPGIAFSMSEAIKGKATLGL